MGWEAIGSNRTTDLVVHVTALGERLLLSCSWPHAGSFSLLLIALPDSGCSRSLLALEFGNLKSLCA